jgi:UPF0755 protein
LILASIVEKETALAEERARIGGVFVERLRLGMRLQTDPTVIYGIGPKFDGNLRRSDLERDGPYNTYVRAGLPPTPIALPGAGHCELRCNPTSAASSISSRPGWATAATSSRRRTASTSVRLPSISAGSGIRTGGVECAGRFITFEGGEGVGKSTQVGRAAAWLRTSGR